MQENQALVDLLDAIPIPNTPEALASDGTTAALSRVQAQLSLVPSASESAEDPQQQQDLAELTKGLDFDDESVLLQLRHAVVRQAGKEWHEMVSRSMGDLVNSICLSAMQPKPYRVFVSQLRFIDTVLQKHIMTLIATSASRSSSSASTQANHITPKQRALQYLALCRVFSTILAFHRKRLGGRNHLILLVLQSLLRPLFIPFAPSKSGVSALSEEDYPFTAVHAAAYSRLLSQLVDPTLASLQPSSNHRKNNLNDPTKTAKSIAGQYLHHLIATYCKELLEGSLGGRFGEGGEMRREIESGMGKVVGVVGVERLRVMNSGLGRGERGVWRGVWGELRRHGHRGVGGGGG
ncbi:MAG: hypothetical protein LQ350_006291 [Teloschistes chrysophthalmus]|nr:MAG: hypothetical protein LQ350_006291 [Niorma chrysophthalma]